MDTKHEAIELADQLDVFYATTEQDDLEWDVVTDASTIIRRQHARIEELEAALNGASNYIDTLGGASQTYRALLTKKD